MLAPPTAHGPHSLRTTIAIPQHTTKALQGHYAKLYARTHSNDPYGPPILFCCAYVSASHRFRSRFLLAWEEAIPQQDDTYSTPAHAHMGFESSQVSCFALIEEKKRGRNHSSKPPSFCPIPDPCLFMVLVVFRRMSRLQALSSC